MTDAPERIWIDPHGKGPNWPEKPVWLAVEFVRADLTPSPEVVKELVEAVRYLLTDVDDDLASAVIARAILAKLEGGE